MKICVVGNNLTSLVLSKALINEKINVTVFTLSERKTYNSNRSIGITKKNIDFFNGKILKINQKFLNSINHIEIYVENKKEKILDFYNSGKDILNLIKAERLFKLLKTDLNKRKNFKIKKITENKFCKNFLLSDTFDLIINCEKDNIINRKFFSKNFKKDYHSFAYTCIVHHQKLKNNKAIQVFTKYGPLAFLPLSKNSTSIVFSTYNEKKVDLKNIENLIKFYNKLYKIKKISKIEKVNLKFSSARDYYKGKILLFGDTLHRVHPLVGQGFNMTLRDLNVLLIEINKRLNLGLPLDSSVLNEFQKKTRHTNLIYSNGINFIQDFFKMDSKLKNICADKFIKNFGKNRFINNLLIKTANRGFSLT
jgi:2-octaprenyl-6-methoxyphenol hydroxylase